MGKVLIPAQVRVIIQYYHMYKHQTDLEVNMQIKLELKILTTNKCSQNHSEIFMTYRVMNQLRLIAII